MNIKAHTIKQDLASAGVWKAYDGASFLIASSSSQVYKAKAGKAYKRLNNREAQQDPGIMLKAATEITADCVLLDWKGVDDDGQPFPCTRENRIALLTNAPDFAAWVAEQAADIANFQAEALAEDARALKSGAAVDHEARQTPGVSGGDSGDRAGAAGTVGAADSD